MVNNIYDLYKSKYDSLSIPSVVFFSSNLGGYILGISASKTCSVAPASDFAWGKLLPSSPWSYRRLPFASWPAAILV